MNMIWVWILVCTFVIDGAIRIVMFLNDKRSTYRTLNGLWQDKTSRSLKDLYKTFLSAVNINLHRFGIQGEFPIEEIEINGN